MTTANENVSHFIAEAREQFESRTDELRRKGIHIAFKWADTIWNIKALVTDRNPNNMAMNLNFLRIGFEKQRDHVTTDCLKPFLEEFSKGAIAHFLVEKSSSFRTLTRLLHALRRLNESVLETPLTSVAELLPIHFTMVGELLKKSGLSQRTSYGICRDLITVVKLLNSFHLTSGRISFKNPISWKIEKAADRRPTELEMDALHHCINNPVDDNERILMEICRLHLAHGGRIGETLTTPAACYFKDGTSAIIATPRETNKSKCNYGLRYFREKTAKGLFTKPLDGGAADIAQFAIDELERLSSAARTRAKLLASMPGRFPLPKENGHGYYDQEDHINRLQITAFLAFNPEMARIWIHKQGIKAVTRVGNTYYYRVGDVEKACLKEVNLMILKYDNGSPALWLHEALCIIFENQFLVGEKKARQIRTLFPQIVSYGRIYTNLVSNGQESAPSMFERRGLSGLDGSPIRINTHAPRHVRNTFLDEARVPQVQQALAMGRTITQNEAYQGGSDISIIQASNLTRLQKLDAEKRTETVKAAVRENLITGSISNAYHSLREMSVVKAEEFLDDQVGQVLVTRYGACTNEWSGQSCPKHNKCFKRCSHLHLTGSESERVELEKELSIQRLHRAKVKELADEGEFRADTALRNLDEEIASIEEVLSKWLQVAHRRAEMESGIGSLKTVPIRVQAFDNGKSHYKELIRASANDRRAL